MKLFSLFTGIGGLDWGLKDMADLVGYSEIKKSSIKILNSKAKNWGDITEIDFKELPDFDILTGGFPCQSFSLAGLRKGFEDTKNKKGQMIFYIYELLKEKKPQFVVLENVKGLLSHNGGKTFKDVFRLLAMAGYYVRVLLLNALDYGLAQNRERLIFLCSKDDFKKKDVEFRNRNVRFKDIRDRGGYKFIKKNDRNLAKIEQKRKFNFELIGDWDRVGTLMTSDGGGEKLVYENGEYRYLTVLECERLQGFPDNYTQGVSDSDRYFALGNAVNVNMSKYLFQDYLRGLWF